MTIEAVHFPHFRVVSTIVHETILVVEKAQQQCPWECSACTLTQSSGFRKYFVSVVSMLARVVDDERLWLSYVCMLDSLAD